MHTVNLDESGVNLNIPYDWKVIENEEKRIILSTDTESEIEDNRLMVIQKHSSVDLGLISSREVLDFWADRIASNESTTSYDLFALLNDGNEFLFAKVIQEKYSEELLTYVFAGLIDNEIIDISYTSLAEHEEVKDYIFSGFLNGLWINQKRVLNPLKEYKFLR